MKCPTGKKPYPTLQAAKAAAAQLADKRARQGNPVVSFLRAYGCACGKFHFGSSRVIDWDRLKQHTSKPETQPVKGRPC